MTREIINNLNALLSIKKGLTKERLYMPKAKIIYQANQEVLGKHLQSKEWVMYSGKLTIYERKTNPVVLKIKSEIFDTFISQFMDEKKEFKSDSVSDVYEKLAKWYYRNGIIFQN